MKTTWKASTVDKRANELKYHSVGEECGFSWWPCYTCQRPLGGDRHELRYVGEDNEVYIEEICIDCALYIANGEIPEGGED